MKNSKEVAAARTWFCAAIVILAAFMLAKDALAGDFKASSPCDNCFRFFEPFERVWSGPVDVLLNPDGSGNLGAGNVRQATEWALEYINMYIVLDMTLQGDTTIVPQDSYDPARHNTVVVNFGELPGFLGEAYILWGWAGDNSINQGRITLATNMPRSCLNGVMLHELLHVLYIHHSDTRHSIMYATPYNSCEYQATLRLDDIIALQELYPARPNRQGVITGYDSTEVCGYQPEVIVDGQSYQVSACIPASGFGEIVVN